MIRTIKITLLLPVIIFFISVPNVSESKDCSHLVKLHEKLMCKAGSDVQPKETTTSEKTKKVKKEKKVRKERGGEDVNTLEKLFKKLDLKK